MALCHKFQQSSGNSYISSETGTRVRFKFYFYFWDFFFFLFFGYLEVAAVLQFLFFTGGIVFLTLVVNGSTTQFLLHLLRMNTLTGTKVWILIICSLVMLLFKI